MTRRRSRIGTLLKLSPLYVVAGLLLYVLLFVDKDFNYLAEAHDEFTAGSYPMALEHLDAALEKKLYRGGDLLQVFMLRARTLNILKGYNRALEDLDKVIQLAPLSEEAPKAWALKGEIQLKLENFQEAIAIFERLSAETDVDDEEKRAEYRSQAAAAAYQQSQAYHTEAKTIVARNVEDSDEEQEALESYISDLHEDYDLAFLDILLEQALSPSTKEKVVVLAQDAKKFYLLAHDGLKDYPYFPFFNPLATLFLANIHYRSDRYAPALMDCSLALKEALPEGQRLAILQIMADIYLELEAYREAADTMDSIFKLSKDHRLRHPLSREILLTRLKARDYKKVIAECDRFIKGGQGDHVISYCLGTACLRQKNLFRAVPSLKRVVDAALAGWTPASEIHLKARRDSFALLHEAYVMEKSYNQALKVIEDAVRLYPEDLEFRRIRAKFLYETLGNPNAAGADYEFLLVNGPRDRSAFDRWFLAREGIFEAANGFTFEDRAVELVDQFERKEEMVGADVKRFHELQKASLFTALEQEIALQVALCRELVLRGRREGAKTLLDSMVSQNPEIIEFSFRLGLMYYIDGAPNLALKEFKKVLRRDPTDHESVKLAIRCCRELGDIVEEGRITRAVFTEDWAVLGHWLLAQLSYDEGKFQNFLRLYRNMRDAPDAVHLDMDLMAARCFIEQGQYAQAAERVNPALIEDPFNIEALKVRTRLLLFHPTIDEETIVETEEPDEEPGAVDDAAIEIPEEAERLLSELEEETAALEAEASLEEAPQEEEVPEGSLPEDCTTPEGLVKVLTSLGYRIARGDVEELLELFLERGRPDLAITLMTDLKVHFIYTPEINRALAAAYMESGQYQEAANILVEHSLTEEDLQWAFGLSLLTEDPVNEVRKVKEKAALITDHSEFYLRSAACASLVTGISESAQNLVMAESFPDSGSYSRYEAEWIDYLSRLINRQVRLGHDVSFNDLPPEPPPVEEPEEEEVPVETGEEEIDEEIPVETEEEEIGEEIPVETGEEEIDEEIPVETGEEDGPPETGEEERSPLRSRFTGKPPSREDFPELDGERTEGEKEKKPLPPLTAERILIDKVPLEERYIEIVPEVVYMENRCRELDPEDVVFIRALLRHLVLRHIEGLEDECREAAEQALGLDKSCGLAARHLLAVMDEPPEPTVVIQRLARSVQAVPHDAHSLALLSRAFAALGWENLLISTLLQLETAAHDPLEVTLLKAEIQLDRDNRTGALELLQGAIDDAAGATPVLKRVLPLALKAGLIDSVFDLADAILDGPSTDEETVQSILGFLERTPIDGRTKALAEKLVPVCPAERRPVIVGVLARCYIMDKEEEKLLELADELMTLLDETTEKDPALYRTFFAVGQGLATFGYEDRALELLTNQYFMRPERGDPLVTMAGIAETMGKIRKSTEYRYLLNLLRPWDVKNARQLAHNLFFETGYYREAYELVLRSKGLTIEDPEEAAKITMGYSFMKGNALQAINHGVKTYFRNEVKYPSIMYLTASMFYALNQNERAHRLFKMLAAEFPDSPFTLKSEYYMTRIDDGRGR